MLTVLPYTRTTTNADPQVTLSLGWTGLMDNLSTMLTCMTSTTATRRVLSLL